MKIRVLLAHRARRLFFFIHLWLGLLIGLWFSLIGVTGSVLAWRGELGDWEIRQRYVLEKPAAEALMISIARAQRAMQMAHPEAKPKQLATVNLPTRAVPFYAFALGDSKKTRQTVLIDPYSARVHEPFRRSDLTVIKIQQYHKNLLAGTRGYLANGFLNLLAIPLVLSGLWLWWPTSKKHLKNHLTLKKGAPLKRRLYDLHNVMGFYLYSLLALTTITGVVIVYQHVEREGFAAYWQGESASPAKNVRKEEKKNEKDEAPVVVPTGKRLSADEVLAKMQASPPSSIKITRKPTEPFEVTYEKNLGFAGSQTFYVNPYDGMFMGEKPVEMNFARVNKQLHLGTFGGLLSKILYTITGFIPLGLFTTGAWLWLHKKLQRRRSAM